MFKNFQTCGDFLNSPQPNILCKIFSTAFNDTSLQKYSMYQPQIFGKCLLFTVLFDEPFLFEFHCTYDIVLMGVSLYLDDRQKEHFTC